MRRLSDVSKRESRLAGVAMLLFILPAPRCAFAQSPAPAPQRSLRTEIAQAVARYMGVEDENNRIAGDLQLLSPPLAGSASTAFHLVSAKPGLIPQSWFLRLECASRHECLPFEVMLRTADPAVAARLSARKLTAATPSVPPPRRTASAATLTRSGERVTLVEELSGMRLTVKAVCLEAGGLGDRIRVRNLATRRVLLATVAAKGEVRVE